MDGKKETRRCQHCGAEVSDFWTDEPCCEKAKAWRERCETALLARVAETLVEAGALHETPVFDSLEEAAEAESEAANDPDWDWEDPWGACAYCGALWYLDDHSVGYCCDEWVAALEGDGWS